MSAGKSGPRILIVDDDELYLASLRRILHGHYITVTTKDPVQALKIVEHQGPFAVVISDFRMPVMNGIDLFSRIVLIDKNIQRILLTGHAELQMAIDAINRGKITTFLTKPIPAVSIRAVLEEAVRAYQQATASTEGRTADSSPPPDPAAAALDVPLTIKEKEVLGLLAKGFSNAEIAEELKVTTGTVKTHLNNLFWKLEVSSRTRAIARGRELGFLPRS